MMKLLAGAVLATGTLAVPVVALALPAAAQTQQAACVTVHDHINKTDNGHGTPSEWADLSLNRTTKVCGDEKAGYKVTLIDKGTLWTRKDAGTPNGTGGQILNHVPGVVYGIYSLTATGGTFAHNHGDTSASSTEYVKSLFSEGTTVTGGKYAWAYQTRCRERWLDSSVNNDGQGAAAGNITGKLCGKPSQTPTPTPTPTSPGGGGGGSTPTTVPSGAPQTGDGSSGGGSTVLVAAGALVCALGAGSGLVLWRRRQQH
jgi:hypothetical protein